MSLSATSTKQKKISTKQKKTINKIEKLSTKQKKTINKIKNFALVSIYERENRAPDEDAGKNNLQSSLILT